METTTTRQRLAPSEDGLRVSASCPGCGARTRIETAEPCLRCPYCQTSHLVVWPEPGTTLVLPNRLRDADEALDAARRGTPLSPDATLARHVFLLAPYWHRSGRVYEAAIGTGPDGVRRRAAAVSTAELSRKAFSPAFSLPDIGKLSYVRSFDLAPAASGHLVPLLPLAAGPDVLGDAASRAAATRIVRALEVYERYGVFVPGPLHLVLRPFHLVAVDTRSGRRYLLLDGASRQLLSEETEDTALRLAAAVAFSPLPLPSALSFRPMRCPDCASRVALEARAQVRFCPGCRKALRIDGSRLSTLRYRVEVPDGPPSRFALLPFWRFRFALTDPRDGAEVSTLEALAARSGGEARAGATRFLDVPAFRGSDRRKAAGGAHPLFDVVRPPLPALAEGPVRGEAGFPEPARFAALLPDEAAATARAALLLAIPEADVAHAAPRRLRELVFAAPLALELSGLVLRAFGKGDVAPLGR